MTAKKTLRKALLITVVFLLLSAAVIGFYFYKKLNTPSELPACIPASAETVVYINFKTIYKRFIRQKDSTLRLKKYKSPYWASIKDPMSTGIDFLGDAACVSYKGKWYVIAMLSSEKKFGETLKQMQAGLFDGIKEHSGYRTIWSKRDSFILAWNSRLVIALPKSGPNPDQALIKEILETDESKSFKHNKAFQQSEKPEALAWFYTEKADIKISAPSTLKGYMNWDTCIHVFSTNHIAAPYSDFPASTLPAGNNYVYTDTGNRFINKSLEALLLVYLPDRIEKLKTFKLDNYPKTFCLEGKKTIENTSVTYEYDENFTKQKIVSTSIDTIRSAYLYIYRPESINFIVSNNNDTSRLPLQTPPPDIKLMTRFNQELLNPIFPFPVQYDVQFIHSYHAGFNYYQLHLKPGDLQALSGLL